MDLKSRPVSLLGALLTCASAATGLVAAVATFALLPFIGATTDTSDATEMNAFAAWCAICLSLWLGCGALGTTAVYFFLHRKRDFRWAMLLQFALAALTVAYAIYTLCA